MWGIVKFGLTGGYHDTDVDSKFTMDYIYKLNLKAT